MSISTSTSSCMTLRLIATTNCSWTNSQLGRFLGDIPLINFAYPPHLQVLPESAASALLQRVQLLSDADGIVRMKG